MSKTFTKTLISSSSSRAHLVEGELEGLAAQLARKLARTGCWRPATQPCTLSSFSGLVEDVGEEHVDLVKLLARVLFKAATATALASTGFSGATLSKTFTKTLISSSSSRAHLVEGGLEGLAAQLARKLARTGC